jgi:hypothetical protein
MSIAYRTRTLNYSFNPEFPIALIDNREVVDVF